jgi:hypothetical protein
MGMQMYDLGGTAFAGIERDSFLHHDGKSIRQCRKSSLQDEIRARVSGRAVSVMIGSSYASDRNGECKRAGMRRKLAAGACPRNSPEIHDAP